MSLKLTFLSLIALLPLGAISQTHPVAGASRSRATIAPVSQKVANHKARTPVERVLVPYLKAKIAASKGDKTAVSASPRVTGLSSSSQPNFGGFLAAPFYSARIEASCITDPYNCGVAAEVTADFDKDGKPDVAVVQFDGTLNVLLNTGSGAFATPVSYLNPNYSSSSIEQVFAVDVNNDGYADIIEFDASNNAVIVFLNQKNGTFGSARTTLLDTTYGYAASVAIGDVNGDGVPDVVGVTPNVTSRTSTDIVVESYLGTTNGTYAAPTTPLTQTFTVAAQVQIPGYTGIALGDLNGDGKLDVALDLEEQTSQTTGTVVATIGLGNGDGSFGTINVTNPVSVPVAAPPGFPFLIFGTSGVQIADLNNDKKNDVAIDANGVLYVALGDGNGGVTSVAQTANFGASSQVVYADVTGDGIPDIVQDNGLLNIWVGKGDGTFSLPVNGNTYILDSGGTESLVLADFTGDGSLDIGQLGQDYKQVSLFVGNGKGGFRGAPALSSTTDGTSDPYFLELEAAGDIAGNGYTDPLFVDESGTAPYVVSGLADGKGGFKYVTALSATAVPTLYFLEPVKADFNGDGMQDLLIVDGALGNGLSVALSNGDGTFKTPVALAMPSLDCPLNYAATGDLNGDGHTDIVVAYPGDAYCGGSDGNAAGYIVALGKGDGTFAAPVFTASGNELYTAVLADMNGDGNLDLIVADDPFDGAGSFAVNLLTGNGDGTFSAGSTILADNAVSQIAVGDINQDGKPDLVLFSEGNVAVSQYGNPEIAGIVLLPGNGDGSFGDSSQLATGNFFLNGAVADVNNDGNPDILAALYHTTGQPNTYYGLSTILGTGNGEFAPPVDSLESMASSVVIPGNFLGDNAPGVLVYTGYGTGFFLGQGGSTLTLTSSAAAVAFGQAETVTATITPTLSGRPAATGTVTFYDGTTLLGSVAITGGSPAAYSSSDLAVGSHSITAIYSGDANFNPNSSTATTVSVTALTPAFTLASNPGTVTVTAGQQALSTLTLTANATFSGSISLACSGLPANASCTVNPSSVTLAAGATSTATLVVGTVTAAANEQPKGFPMSGYAGGVSLAGLLCCFAFRKSNRRIFSMVALFLLAITVAAVSGCNNGNGLNTAKKGTYTATITATPSGSSATAQTTTVSITIQ